MQQIGMVVGGPFGGPSRRTFSSRSGARQASCGFLEGLDQLELLPDNP
jgi:hypothetical protein